MSHFNDTRTLFPFLLRSVQPSTYMRFYIIILDKPYSVNVLL